MAEISQPLGLNIDTNDGGLAVINATANLTMQRTIVEAFVKLVVCRKITVQQVAAVSGQVLDSQTTQEEESPVILDVHRHEVGDVFSALRSNSSSSSDPDSHNLPRRCSSMLSQHIDIKEERSHGNCKDWCGDDCGMSDLGSGVSENSQSNLQSSAGLYESSTQHSFQQTGCKQKNDRVTGSSREDKCYPVGKSVQGPYNDNYQTLCDAATGECTNDTRKTTCETFGKTCLQKEQICKKRKLEDGDLSENDKGDESEDRRSAGITQLSAGKEIQSLGSSQSLKERMGKDKPPVTQSDADFTKDCGAIKAADRQGDSSVKAVDSSAEQNPLPAETEESTPCVEENMEMCAVERKSLCDSQRPDKCLQGSEVLISQPSENEVSMAMSVHHGCDDDNLKGTGNRQHGQDKAQDKSDEEGMSDNLSGEERISADVSPESGTLQSSQCATNSNSGADKISQSHESDDQIDPEEDNFEQHAQVREGTLNHDGTEENRTQVTEKYSGMLETPDTDPSKLSHASEDDADQDMLVIDISSSVSEPAGQVTDSDVTDTTQGQRRKPVEKPDPFHHLLTSFPPLDMTRNKLSQVAGKSLPGPSKSGRSAVKEAPVSVKEEQDDDCMITAAFISPPVRKRSASHTVTNQIVSSHTLTNQSTTLRTAASQSKASHTVTNQSGMLLTSSAIGMRRELFGRGPRPRHGVEHYSQFRVSPLQQFTQSVQGREIEDNQGSAAVTYQSAADYPLSLTNATPVSKPYIPNFLASVSQSAQHSDTGAVPLQHPEGLTPIDYSQQTYQCNICCKIFLHRHKFDRHSLMCGGHRPFKCKICSKGFNQRAHLDTHMKFHIGIKRYRCEPCRKAYVMKGDLIRHLKTRGHRTTLQNHMQ